MPMATARFNEEASEMAVLLLCNRCPQREVMPMDQGFSPTLQLEKSKARQARGIAIETEEAAHRTQTQPRTVPACLAG